MCLCFLNENMVKPVQNDGVLQKTLSKLERVCKQVKCVGDLFQELYEWFGKLFQMNQL